MPFRRRLLTQPLPTRTPDVDIYFHGQLLLRSDGAICDIGINPVAKDHVLTVEVRTRFPNSADDIEKTIPDAVDVTNMRHVGPLHFRVPQGMTIETSEPDTIAVWKCVGEDNLDFVNGVGRFNEDFRWILNLEGSQFHNQQLNVPVFQSQNTIRLKEGEYFFRTAFRSPFGLKYDRTRGAEQPLEFRGIGAVARASVLLSRDQNLSLKWNDGSRERSLLLTRSLAGITYEIYIQNVPLFQEALNREDLSEFEELQHYYQIIPDVLAEQKFKLTPFDDPQGGETGTPTIPCQVMRLDWPDTD